MLVTLAVEATIHHLDLLTAGDLSGPSVEGLAAVRMTLDGILGGPVPALSDDATYALKGTGRSELTPRDRRTLVLSPPASRCSAEINPGELRDRRQGAIKIGS